jgi:hypothetical protein
MIYKLAQKNIQRVDIRNLMYLLFTLKQIHLQINILLHQIAIDFL